MSIRMMVSRNARLLPALCALAVAGCGSGPQQGTEKGQPAAKEPGESGAQAHAGWWCVEHGVPEEECSLCSAKAAAKFKAQGDWCGEHNRAESQCFLCDPSRAEEFAALYKAKYGRRPPQPKQ